MNVITWWVISGLFLVVAAAVAGKRSAQRNVLGILIDDRGRFSLSQFQMVLWTIIVLSLLIGVFIARVSVPGNPLNIDIPDELLIVMGISIGSAASATAIKAGKDMDSVSIIGRGKPKFSQVFLEEEGKTEAVSVTKFQNFWLTLILVAAYVVTAARAVHAASVATDPFPLPGFNDTFLILLGASHAGYLAGKLPKRV